MVEVCRGNVYLDISEEEIDKYMAKGFSVVDKKTSKIIKQSIPTSLDELQKAYTDHINEIKNLKLENSQLKSKLQALTAEGKKPSAAPKGEKPVEDNKKPESDDSWDDWADAEEVEAEEKPKKKRKSSKE